jgi:hypothetical protein
VEVGEQHACEFGARRCCVNVVFGDPRLPSRFWSKCKPTDAGCWVWTARRDAGYGRFRFDGRIQQAHRVSYTAIIGPIQDGLHIDHLCRTRACCNPEHLEPVTCRENVLRGLAPAARQARQTHCMRGHILAGNNLSLGTHKSGGRFRICITCNRTKVQEWRERMVALGAPRDERGRLRSPRTYVKEAA